MQQVVLQDAFRKLPKMPGRCKILFIVQLFGKTIYYFLTLDTMIKIITTTKPTRKKAHHIPALNIVSIAPQLLKTNRVKKKRNKYSDNLIIEFFNKLKNSTIIPFCISEWMGKICIVESGTK